MMCTPKSSNESICAVVDLIYVGRIQGDSDIVEQINSIDENKFDVDIIGCAPARRNLRGLFGVPKFS